MYLIDNLESHRVPTDMYSNTTGKSLLSILSYTELDIDYRDNVGLKNLDWRC